VEQPRVLPDNSLNTGKGRDFQSTAAEILGAHFQTKFDLDVALDIGSPPKVHRFDLVSTDRKFVGECKNYCWTIGGNVPSAKMAFMNEAMLYLSLAPIDSVRFITLRRDTHPRTGEALADYYCRTYRHLFHGAFLIEIDLATSAVREIGRV
jgi:hypothetical protein